MMKNKSVEKLVRFLITLLGAGIGAALAALLLPILSHMESAIFSRVSAVVLVYAVLCLICAGVFLALSGTLIHRAVTFVGAFERRWDAMPTQQIVLSSIGLIAGLVVAALVSQLILSAGASLLTISASALIYVALGYVGMQIGYRRYRGKGLRHLRRRHPQDEDVADSLLADASALIDGEDEREAPALGLPAKFLDTSVIIDGRILDIAKTGFLEGELVVPAFVLAELRHIADSSDSLRRARGRRGLDVLGKLRKELKTSVTVDETDYPEVDEVDVKLLRLCRDKGGAVITNDYNLNKVAGVTGIRVLNINDLANAVKPMLMAGEEMNVQIVREGKEPGQGVAYLDDGTMIVVENGRRYVGEAVAVIVTTVLQTSAGRMIFTKLKAAEEKAAG